MAYRWRLVRNGPLQPFATPSKKGTTPPPYIWSIQTSVGGGIMEWTQLWFSIVLAEEDAIKLFGTSIRIYRLASVDHINRKPRLICNSSEDPDDITCR